MQSTLMRVTRSAFFLCWMLSNCSAHAASFDCAKAASPAEKKICASRDLSALDTELGSAYTAALGLDSDNKGLRDEQRAWLKTRDVCLADREPCGNIAERFRARIEQLRQRILETNCDATSGPEVAACASQKALVAEKALTELLAQMKAQLFYPDKELAAQEAWKDYRERECRSRITMSGTWGGAEYQQCLADFAVARTKDLRALHFCDEGGCPAKK